MDQSMKFETFMFRAVITLIILLLFFITMIFGFGVRAQIRKEMAFKSCMRHSPTELCYALLNSLDSQEYVYMDDDGELHRKDLSDENNQ